MPGDQVEIEIEPSQESTPHQKVYSGIGKVGAKRKVVVEFEGDLVPFEEIEDIDEQRRFFKVLTRER
jgi:hypothetical protein